MTAAFHNAVIQQSNGERPVATIYDKYYGDVTQQGIILDKYFSMLDWTGLWPTTNYDLNQAGVYRASYDPCRAGGFRKFKPLFVVPSDLATEKLINLTRAERGDRRLAFDGEEARR